MARSRHLPSHPHPRPLPARGGENGRLADNIAYFARALRAAGLPVGPGAVLDAVEAIEVARIGTRQDFYWTLHTVFVKRHEHSILFDQAFRIFWRRREMIEKLIASMSPIAPGGPRTRENPRPGAARRRGARPSRNSPAARGLTEFSARLTMSEQEICALRTLRR
jgi:uncharacterized protein with von Willebrand factor type A (vWA) domain